MNLLFISTLILGALAVFRGWRRGLLGLIYGVFSWVFLVGFVAIANPYIYHYLITNETIYQKVYTSVYPYADASVPENMGNVKIKERESAPGAGGAQKSESASGEGKTQKSEAAPGAESPPKSEAASGNGGGAPSKGNKGGKRKAPSDNIHIDKDIIEKSGLPIPGVVKDLIPEEGVDLPPEVSDKIKEGGTVEIPKELQGIVDSLEESGVNVDDYIGMLNGGLEQAGQTLRKVAVKKACEEGTKRAMKILAMALSYLIAKVICVIIGFVIRSIKDLPAIGKVERVGGAVLGLVETCLYLWVFMLVIMLIQPSPMGQELYRQVQENVVLKTMYEQDPFIPLVKGFL